MFAANLGAQHANCCRYARSRCPPATSWVKLGQPQPESNLSMGVNSVPCDDIHIEPGDHMVPIITGKKAVLWRRPSGLTKLLRGQAKPNLLRRGLRVGLLFCFKILQGFEADVAVAVWILFQVLLVVFLGGIELFQREAFHRNGGLVFFAPPAAWRKLKARSASSV